MVALISDIPPRRDGSISYSEASRRCTYPKLDGRYAASTLLISDPGCAIRYSLKETSSGNLANTGWSQMSLPWIYPERYGDNATTRRGRYQEAR